MNKKKIGLLLLLVAFIALIGILYGIINSKRERNNQNDWVLEVDLIDLEDSGITPRKDEILEENQSIRLITETSKISIFTEKSTSIPKPTPTLTSAPTTKFVSKTELAPAPKVASKTTKAIVIEETIIETAQEPVVESTTLEEPTKKSSAKFTLTKQERRDVAALIYLEGGAESKACQKMIAEVIFNQWRSRGGSIYNTLYAKNLFSPAQKIKKTAPKQTQYDIVDEICKNGVSIPSDVLYFRAGHYHSWATPYKKIGKTYFSRKK